MKNLKNIKIKSKNINIKEASEEVLNWLIDNVEEYIDNKETIFCLYFPVNNINYFKMPNLRKLGELYLSLNDKQFEDERKCINYLDNIVDSIKQEITNNTEVLTKLFKRLIWYYEMVGFHPQTGPIIQELDGYISINKFFYEPIELKVEVIKKYNRLTQDGLLKPTDKKEILKKETIPESFVIEFEIKSWVKQKTVSIF